MNIFKAFKHINDRKPRPEHAVIMDGEVIISLGQKVDCLHLLVSGTVVAYGLSHPTYIANRTRTYRRIDKEQEPSPIFGADNYFYCRPSNLIYRAIGHVELCRIGSDVVLDLGQKDSILVLARELIRDSDMSAALLKRLAVKFTETGLPGFNTENPSDILTADSDAHITVYTQFAQELMMELFIERRNRSINQTTEMVAYGGQLLKNILIPTPLKEIP
jgi:hypothetical protein